MVAVALIALLFYGLCSVAIGFSPCLECKHYEPCPAINTEDCKHGVVKDRCNCCPVCAHGEGEACGGIFYGPNRCSANAKCIVEVEFGVPYTIYIQLNGTCQRLNTISGMLKNIIIIIIIYYSL